MSTRAVFLDRDGVLNLPRVIEGQPHPPVGVADLAIAPDAAASLARLAGAGFRLIVVTNQPDVARGVTSRAAVEAINAVVGAQLGLDEFRVCYHDDADQCACRKPQPGLLLDAAREHGIDLAASFMIGDRWRDIDAGSRAGCRTVLIDHDYDEAMTTIPDARARTLHDAVSWILSPDRGLPDRLDTLRVKIFADGADVAGMLEVARLPYVKGFTTNPTLMRKAGIRDYRAFAREVVCAIPNRPISFEVFSDELDEMERQAREIASWGENVYVKVPITTTRRESTLRIVAALSAAGVKVNVTALLTLGQVRDVVTTVAGGAPCCVSVFAGRIADTGRDPVPIMAAAVELLGLAPNAELIWASPRELLNVFHADAVGCHIITMTNDLLKKLSLLGKDLEGYSLDTVRMFRTDAQAAAYSV